MLTTVVLVSLLQAASTNAAISLPKLNLTNRLGQQQSAPNLVPLPGFVGLSASKPANNAPSSIAAKPPAASPLAQAALNNAPIPAGPALRAESPGATGGGLSDDSVRQSWLQFKQDYGKSYPSAEEEQRRFEIFKNNFQKIVAANSTTNTLANGTVVARPYSLGMNDLLDRTDAEFSVLNGLKPPTEEDIAAFSGARHRRKRWATTDKVCGLYYNQPPSDLPSGPIPYSFDWRNKGVVLAPVQQGACGSCWAFAAMGVFNIMTYILRQKLGMKVPVPDTQLYGEQMVVDCVPNGCNGGFPSRAWDFIHNSGVVQASIMPYTSYNGSQAPQCTWSCDKPTLNRDFCKAFVSEFTADEDHLKRIVATVGPVAVNIVGNSLGFRNYRSGVYANDPDCGNVVDHSVIVIGYGSDAMTGLEYWIVRNSWGTNWGDKGYIKMARNQNNYCNIASAQFYVMNLETSVMKHTDLCTGTVTR